MVQDIITYFLIASATAYILFSLYRMIYPSKNVTGAGCPGCGGCSANSKILPRRSYSSGSGSVPAAGAGKGWVPRDFASADLANRQQ
jgi:hypothetical protein